MFDLRIASLNREMQELKLKSSSLLKEVLTMYPEIENGDYSCSNNFKDFPSISEDILIRLEAIGIKNTLQLYEEVLTPACRLEFSIKTGISVDKVLMLCQLADISRIKCINHNLAFILFKAGYTNTKEVSNAEPAHLYLNITKHLNEIEISELNLGVNQVKLIIESAKCLSLDIEYN